MKHNKKIMIVAPNLKRGGAERVLSELSQEWSCSYEVIFILFDNNNIAYDYRGKVISLNTPANNSFILKTLNFFKRIIRLVKLLKVEKPKTIISFTESANFVTLFACLFTGNLKNIIISTRVAPETFGKILKFLIKLFYPLSSKIIVPSNGIKKALIKLKISHDKIKFIPNPVNLNPKTISKKIPKKYSKYVLAVGRLEKQKGFDLLIESFSNIEDKTLNLVILGEGSERKNLENLAKKFDFFNRRIFLPGSVNNIQEWYKKADMFVLSSRYEGWPNVLIEAMAFGCPVISFDCHHGPSEMINHNVNGLLIRSGDTKGLTKSINELNSNNKKKLNFIKEGKKFSKKFERKKIAQKWAYV